MQFKVPDYEIERLQQAPNEDTQLGILERLAQDLPVTNRTVRGGKKY